MSIEEKRRLMLRLDQFFRMKVPGNSLEIAARLEISRSTFFRCIDEMKMLGAPIEFDTNRGAYVYTHEGKLKFEFERKSA